MPPLNACSTAIHFMVLLRLCLHRYTVYSEHKHSQKTRGGSFCVVGNQIL